VKFNVNKVDNMVIQAIALLDTLDKDINTFIMRVREWYSWHFPELVKVRAAGLDTGTCFDTLKYITLMQQRPWIGVCLVRACSPAVTASNVRHSGCCHSAAAGVRCHNGVLNFQLAVPTAQIVPDNYLYARVALVVKDKGSLSEEKLPELAEVLADEAKAKEVSGTPRHATAASAAAAADAVVGCSTQLATVHVERLQHLEGSMWVQWVCEVWCTQCFYC
jgi:hypothetical protein